MEVSAMMRQLVHAPGHPHLAVFHRVRIDAGSTNAVAVAREPGIVFRVNAFDVEGRTIEALTVHHRVHGALPAYCARRGSPSRSDGNPTTCGI